MKRERIYTPNQKGGWGLEVWNEIIDEMVSSRELIWRLFIRDFSARYRQSVLGILWALILPLISVATFVFLNLSGLLRVGETGIPYPVYAFVGLMIWQVFAGGLAVCSNAIILGGTMVVKINFPKETLVISAMGQVIFELLVRIALLAIIVVIFGGSPKWTVIFFPFTLIPLIMLTTGLGFILALMNVLLRDVANMITVVTTLLMFLTPIVYPVPQTGLLAKVMAINPLTWLVTASRDVIFSGYFTNSVGFVWASGLSLAFFFFAWRLFHLVEFKMPEVI